MCLLGLTLLFKDYEAYATVLGSLSAMVEACLGIPQFLLNFKNKNTLGLSIHLIVIWFGGDCYKLLYYTKENSPF